MFLEFVKDEATATEAKLKLHLSPAHIISSAAGGKKINLLHWRFFLVFSASYIFGFALWVFHISVKVVVMFLHL